MAQEYLPAPSNIRLADLMKEHNISQPELAKEIGCSKSTISRFISGAKGTLTHEQVLRIARLFNVSTDFLLGETNIPDRKNYDIAELGLSVEAAKNLYTGRVNTEVVNLLLENALCRGSLQLLRTSPARQCRSSCGQGCWFLPAGNP